MALGWCILPCSPWKGGTAPWLLARGYSINRARLGTRHEILDWHKAPLQGWEPKNQEKSRCPLWVSPE